MNIVFCLPGKSFSGKFLECWTSLIGYCQLNKINVVLSQRYNSNVYYVRAQCLGADVTRGKYQKPFDGKLPYDYIMWIDSDIIFTVDDFKQLLSNKDKDIVSGLYLMDGGEYYATVKDWDIDKFKKQGSFDFIKKEDVYTQIGLPFNVSYSGFGFMLIKYGVFESIEYPWFGPEYFEFDNIYDFCSEDVAFCKKVEKAGYQIWIDPNVKVKHEKTKLY